MATLRRAQDFFRQAPAEAAGDAIGLVAMVALVALGFAVPALF